MGYGFEAQRLFYSGIELEEVAKILDKDVMCVADAIWSKPSKYQEELPAKILTKLIREPGIGRKKALHVITILIKEGVLPRLDL